MTSWQFVLQEKFWVLNITISGPGAKGVCILLYNIQQLPVLLFVIKNLTQYLFRSLDYHPTNVIAEGSWDRNIQISGTGMKTMYPTYTMYNYTADSLIICWKKSHKILSGPQFTAQRFLLQEDFRARKTRFSAPEWSIFGGRLHRQAPRGTEIFLDK